MTATCSEPAPNWRMPKARGPSAAIAGNRRMASGCRCTKARWCRPTITVRPAWWSTLPTSTGRPSRLPATKEQHADPAWLADPQFWIQPPAGRAQAEYALGFKDVTAPTNVRTMIAAIIPTGAAGNTLPLLELTEHAEGLPLGYALFLANMDCVVFDFIARQKVQGQHLNWFIVEQLPVIPPDCLYPAASATGPPPRSCARRCWS